MPSLTIVAIYFTFFPHLFPIQDVKTKMPEKANIGFPVSDGLGRLQVTFLFCIPVNTLLFCELPINLGDIILQIIMNSDLEELRELGSGTFGTVYHGKWRGTDVAIKRINDRCFSGKASEQERMVCAFHDK